MRKEKIEELNNLINECKTLKKELLENEKSKFLKVQVYNCELANGMKVRREKLLKGNTTSNAVVMMPIINNEALITVESRVFTDETVGIGFPAGYIEHNEAPIISANRELLEETGYKADQMIYLDSFYQDQGISNSKNYIYLAKDIHKISEPHLDGSEYLKSMFVTIDELYELERLGYIKSASNKLLLMKAANYLGR